MKQVEITINGHMEVYPKSIAPIASVRLTAIWKVQLLQATKANLHLQSALLKLDKHDLLILDDLSYVKKSDAETSVLFELIAHRYELKSLMITANHPFSA